MAFSIKLNFLLSYRLLVRFASDHNVGDCQSLLAAFHSLHAFLAADKAAVIWNLEGFSDILLLVLGIEELEVAKSDHGFYDHPYGHLDLYGESIPVDHVLQAVILQELVDLLHARLA